MKTKQFETIYEALSKRTGLRASAIEKWSETHKVDLFLLGGKLVGNVQLFVMAVVSNTLPQEFQQN